MAEYKSIERRILDSKPVKATGRFAYNLGRYAYETVAIPFRIPTFVRKFVNGQDPFGEKNKAGTEFGGAIVGFISGEAISLIGAMYLFLETSKENYIPLAVLGATNLASLAFELGRLPRSREECREPRREL